MTRHFDYIAIGGGSAGIASVNRAAAHGKKCALIEKGPIGGTCVNVGCVPKKVMWYAAQVAETIRTYSSGYGFSVSGCEFDWATLVKNRSEYIERIHGSYDAVLSRNAVEVIQGTARFTGPRSIEVNGETLTADHILIATGGHPVRPSVSGAELGIDSDGFFELSAQPRRAAVIGAGYIAVELAGVLHSLGTETHLLVRGDKPLRHFDPLLGDTLESLAEQRKISAVITIPSGHNPLGFVMPSENRQRLARMAETRQFAVIEDVIYAELQFGDTCIPNIRAFDRDGWVMVCASYTKTIAPDFRIGWLDAGRFRDVARQMKFTSTVAESGLLSESLGIFLESGGYDLHLRHLRRLYERQIDAVRACIADYFPAGTRVSRPQAGFILWIELPEGADTLALFHAALDEKILCMPGLLCSGSRAFNHCFRMAACFELTDRHRMAISRLGALAAHQLNEMK